MWNQLPEQQAGMLARAFLTRPSIPEKTTSSVERQYALIIISAGEFYAGHFGSSLRGKPLTEGIIHPRCQEHLHAHKLGKCEKLHGPVNWPHGLQDLAVPKHRYDEWRENLRNGTPRYWSRRTYQKFGSKKCPWQMHGNQILVGSRLVLKAILTFQIHKPDLIDPQFKKNLGLEFCSAPVNESGCHLYACMQCKCKCTCKCNVLHYLVLYVKIRVCDTD